MDDRSYARVHVHGDKSMEGDKVSLVSTSPLGPRLETNIGYCPFVREVEYCAFFGQVPLGEYYLVYTTQTGIHQIDTALEAFIDLPKFRLDTARVVPVVPFSAEKDLVKAMREAQQDLMHCLVLSPSIKYGVLWYARSVLTSRLAQAEKELERRGKQQLGGLTTEQQRGLQELSECVLRSMKTLELHSALDFYRLLSILCNESTTVAKVMRIIYPALR